METVRDAAVLGLDAKSRLDQILRLVAFGEGCVRKGRPSGRRPAEPEALYGLVIQPTGMQVGKTDITSLISMQQAVNEELLSELRYKHQTLRPLPCGNILDRLLLLLDLDMILVGQILQRLDIGIVLMLHDEADGRSGLAATEAFEDALRGRNIEGGGLFIVERAAGDEVGSATPERHEVTYHFVDPGSVQDPVNRFLRYHTLAKRLSRRGT